MAFDPLPRAAAWRHVDARDGFEVVFMQIVAAGFRFEDETVAVEDGQPWWVHYATELSDAWFTPRARLAAFPHGGPGNRPRIRRRRPLAHR